TPRTASIRGTLSPFAAVRQSAAAIDFCVLCSHLRAAMKSGTPVSPELRRRALDLVSARLGLQFQEDRYPEFDRGLVEAALAAGPPSREGFLAQLARLPLETPAWESLIARITVGETYFFRDTPCFEALEKEVLPRLLAARASSRTLRVW